MSPFHFLGGVLSFFAFFGEGCFLLLDSSCWVLIEFFGRGSNVEIAPSNLRGFDKFISFGFEFSVFRFFSLSVFGHTLASSKSHDDLCKNTPILACAPIKV